MNDIEQAAAAEFDRWAISGRDASMARGHGPFTEQALAAWSLTADSRVLDVGCGNGWAVRRMIALGAGSGTGVDIAPEMIARATPPGAYCVAAGDDLPFADGRFTHILSIESLYYYPDPGKALVEWLRVAAPGARLSVLLDLYAESPAAAAWATALPIAVHVLSEQQWAALARSQGWSAVSVSRLHDPAPIQPEASFTASQWYPDYATYRGYREAGTLWLQAQR